MNSVVLIGRLTRDVELRYTPQNETAVGTFTLAVDRPFAKEKTADFIRIVTFGRTAEICNQYLAKGRQVAVQGRIQTGSYQTQTGETRYTTEVYADRVEFLDRGAQTGWENRGEHSERQEFSSMKSDSKAPTDLPDGIQLIEDDDDIPF
ncbi:MAG TPA: single-stranded DNA-binding protein [Clostridiales bacterium]|jgi:single-strand DNA-binding protein|nr:single-stranded DNA-binding protein [Clostridiales bacterium]